MKRFLTGLFCLSVLAAQAQHRCATVEKTDEVARQNAEYAEGKTEFEDMCAQYESGALDNAHRDTKQLDLPVVVHVLYQSEANNVSYEQIKSQIDALNRDFDAAHGELDQIPEVWRGLAVSAGIRFHLADKDPDGNFTNGITRTQTNQSDIGDTDNYYKSSHGGVDPWPQPHYINIWVCEISSTILGYTILPSSTMAANDGIVIDPRAFGTTGTAQAPYNMGRTLVHEMGHYLGLRHVWGSDDESCTSTDYMSDTPWQMEANFGCSNFPHLSCINEGNGDMFMNYMDYANDSCALLFTERQVSFMRLVLLTSRVTLLHSQAYTGVNELSDASPPKIYPNPSEGVFHVEFPAGERPVEGKLINAKGQVVKTIYPQTDIIRLDLQGFEKGVYYFVSPYQTSSLVLI